MLSPYRFPAKARVLLLPLLLASFAWSVAVAPAQAAPTLTNPGFETSDLTGWSGTGSVVQDFSGYLPQDGAHFAVVPGGCATNMLSQSFTVQAGQTISGWSFFKAGDYLPYNDSGSVQLVLASNNSSTVLFSASVSQVGNYGGTPWRAWAYTFPSAGTYTLEVRSSNDRDCGVTSYVGIDLPAPPAGGHPTVGGNAYQGKTLTADAQPATWAGSPTGFAYRWQRCTAPAACTDIPGADAATYTVTGDDLDHTLLVQVTATNASGSGTAAAAPSALVSKYFKVVLADRPLAYWRLGDAADASSMTDVAGAHAGEYKNGAGGSPRVGISGDGNTTGVFVGNGTYGFVNNLTAPQTAYTLEAWVNPADTDDAMIVQHGSAGALAIRGGHVFFRQVDTDVTGPALPTGTFSHVVGTWDGHTAILYVDGVPVGSAASEKAPSGTSTFYVGYGDLAPWLRGSLDEVAYYDHALTGEHVLWHFEADPPPLAVFGGLEPEQAPTADDATSASGSSDSGAPDGAALAAAAPASLGATATAPAPATTSVRPSAFAKAKAKAAKAAKAKATAKKRAAAKRRAAANRR
ncbi:MAG: hypothetical protein JWO02_1238 [Solirubrobacterales bacterium]|nr:hypothetical protein [Solirubrobacterales bacterium]